MSENHPINGLMSTVLSNIKEMVDVNTIVGSPITTPDGITIIPVSKVSFGFASGGSEFSNPKASVATDSNLFGGGNGAGAAITPVAFLVVSNGFVKLLPIASSSNTVDKLIDSVPDVIDKVNGIIKEYKPPKNDQ